MNKSKLQVINGARANQEKQAFELLLTGDAQSINAAIESLKPRGRLELIDPSNTGQPALHPSNAGNNESRS